MNRTRFAGLMLAAVTAASIGTFAGGATASATDDPWCPDPAFSCDQDPFPSIGDGFGGPGGPGGPPTGGEMVPSIDGGLTLPGTPGAI